MLLVTYLVAGYLSALNQTSWSNLVASKITASSGSGILRLLTGFTTQSLSRPREVKNQLFQVVGKGPTLVIDSKRMKVASLR